MTSTGPHFARTVAEIHACMKTLDCTNHAYTINEDMTVDMTACTIHTFDGEYLPVRFGTVKNFRIFQADNLISLAGSPSQVTGDLTLSGCTSLTSLDHGPTSACNATIKRCSALKTLEGMPSVDELLVIKALNVTSLVGISGANRLTIEHCDFISDMTGTADIREVYDIASCANLNSLRGCSKSISRFLQISNCHSLMNLEGAPEHIGMILRLRNMNISLADVNEHIKSIGNETSNKGHLICEAHITNGGIGLTMIKNLAGISSDSIEVNPALGIIYSYLGRPDDIFECQAELIDKGFDAFAIL